MVDYDCFCHDPDHEQCFDGLIGIFDENCSCCVDTMEQVSRAHEAIDNRRARKQPVIGVTILHETLEALIELSRHPAFEDDAPEFNEGGIGHEACRKLREFLNGR